MPAFLLPITICISSGEMAFSRTNGPEACLPLQYDSPVDDLTVWNPYSPGFCSCNEEACQERYQSIVKEHPDRDSGARSSPNKGYYQVFATKSLATQQTQKTAAYSRQKKRSSISFHLVYREAIQTCCVRSGKGSPAHGQMIGCQASSTRGCPLKFPRNGRRSRHKH